MTESAWVKGVGDRVHGYVYGTRPPYFAMFAGVGLAVVPLIVWVSGPSGGEYPPELAAVSGTILAAITFMLGMAQRSYQDALNTVAKELAERDSKLCASATGDDPEPWPQRANQEIATIYSVTAIAGFRPGEHRYRTWNRERADQAHRLAWNTEFSVAWTVSTAFEEAGAVYVRGESGQQDREDLQRWVDRGLSGQVQDLPARLRAVCNWDALSKRYQRAHRKESQLQEAFENVERRSLGRHYPFQTLSLLDTQRVGSPLASEFEGVLRSYVRPLDVASVLALAIVSLSATGWAYSRQGLNWPWPPAAWASLTIIAVTIVYLVVVRRSLAAAGAGLGARLLRLGVPSLIDAANLLGDGLVDQALGPRGDLGYRLQQDLSCLVGAENVPLRHRILGQMHLHAALSRAGYVDYQKSVAERSKAGHTQDEFAGHRLEIEQAVYTIGRELDLAKMHLELCLASGRDDDSIALLASATTLEQSHHLYDLDEPEAAEKLVRRAVAPTYLSTLEGAARRAEIDNHKWLWPQAGRGLLESRRET